MDKLSILKLNIREEAYPMFSDEELQYFLEKNGGNVDKASHECLILKSENTGLEVSSLTTSDSSGYFKMLAARYVTTNTGLLT